jgi:hypothetical protein
MKQMTKRKKTIVSIGVVLIIIFSIVGYDLYDPFYLTDKRVNATVIRAVQKLQRYSSDFKEIVVETSEGQRYTFRVQSSSIYREGNIIELRVMKRIRSGRTKYIL